SLESYLLGLEREGLYGAVYGHLFENRLHIAISPRSAAERDKAIRLLRGLAEDALKAGGSCASEYGEGKLETPWLDPVNCAKRDARLVALRSFFDPQGRMGD
ncbi:MAG TPA: FAD-linked oxidase C-terminal domain-containing protein, partial [Clostridia bacterium]|nr:FAD-linked oxidase C-terminal domain-containing protein [Clostridia bacterium]